MKHKVVLAGLFIASMLLFILGDKSWLMFFVFFLIYAVFMLAKKLK
jgi:hypothetical protein